MASKPLLVDIGNSNISWKIDDNYNNIEVEKFQSSAIPKHQSSVISCVANDKLIQHFNNPVIVKPKSYKNLIFNYDLEQLGVDRFLNIVAGYEQFSGQDFMLIDIGTFVTIDYVQNNQHIDGGITPGLTYLQACKTFAGDDSQKSWHLGTKNMLCDYIKQQCSIFQGKILITGGDQKIVNIEQGEYYQNLVIIGLDIIKDTFQNGQ